MLTAASVFSSRNDIVEMIIKGYNNGNKLINKVLAIENNIMFFTSNDLIIIKFIPYAQKPQGQLSR